MSNLKTMHSNIIFLQETFKKLEDGLLELDEIDQMVKSSLEIYERTIILRYKAYESLILKGHSNTNQEIDAEFLTKELKRPEEEKDDVEMEIEKGVKEEEMPIEQAEYEESEVVESSFTYDLFNDNTHDFLKESVNEGAVESINFTSSIHEESNITEDHLIKGQVKEVPKIEANKEFIDLYSIIEPDLLNQIGMSRLETLNNCFGLNEKFVYINELFNGSKDAFNDAILKLDNEASYQEALLTASIYANQFNWNIEGSTVKDFIIKLKRRHG